MTLTTTNSLDLAPTTSHVSLPKGVSRGKYFNTDDYVSKTELAPLDIAPSLLTSFDVTKGGAKSAQWPCPGPE
ncbi:hypothetical protein J6590_080152 [Homalodisca vitripennis]|nr:hypothetical protein J6590_080152 [Homalodisca vitripennis]